VLAPLNRLAGWFLIPLGQRSLYTFILHVYIVLAVSQLVTFDLWRQAWIENTLSMPRRWAFCG
jgi:hypothetical protein